MTITCITVDDEPLALEVLQDYIEHIPNLQLIKNCSSVLEAFSIIHQKKVDLMFIDINMPEMNGLEFIRALKSPPLTILTTAYPDYALESYQLNVVDYLLKPIPLERFLQAVEKAIPLVQQQKQQLSTPPSTTFDEAFLFIKSERQMLKIDTKDIHYIKASGDYVSFHFAEKKPIIAYGTLQKVETKLPKKHFIRVHRSYIVALHHIDAIIGNMVKVGKEKIAIGKGYKKRLEAAINNKRLL